MNTEAMTALDDEVDHDIDSRLISVAPFSPASLSASQHKQLELLQHLSLYSELLILFSGEKGMGKTFIAQALIASREAPDQSLMVDADFSLSYLDVLHKIAQYLDLAELDDVEELEQCIVQYCEQLLEDEQGSFLLVVDQADQLTNQALLHLNQLALMQPNALHIMLLATPVLEEVLVELPEPHAPLHIMQVEYLVEDESEIILLEQFPEQEWSGEQVDYMLQQSKGSPGKLMYIAQRLVEGIVEQSTKEKAKFPITHVAAILLVASMLVLSVLYKNSQPISQNVKALVIAAPVLIDVEVSAQESTSNQVKGTAEEEIDFNFIEPVEVTAASKNIIDSVSIRKAVPSPVTKPPSPAITQAEVTKSTSVTKTVVEKPQVAEKARGSLSDAEQILMAVSSSAFVAQLFGSHSEKSAQIFMRENKSQAGSLLSYRTEHKGKPWFVVVSEPFESKKIAKEAVANLPAKLRKQQPWVRSIEPIQALLGER
jgi:DamX protein